MKASLSMMAWSVRKVELESWVDGFTVLVVTAKGLDCLWVLVERDLMAQIN